jgi:hypothetical protein
MKAQSRRSCVDLPIIVCGLHELKFETTIKPFGLSSTGCAISLARDQVTYSNTVLGSGHEQFEPPAEFSGPARSYANGFLSR